MGNYMQKVSGFGSSLVFLFSLISVLPYFFYLLFFFPIIHLPIFGLMLPPLKIKLK